MEVYIYWISTGMISLLYLGSASMYVARGQTVRKSMLALGYPAYLVTVLIVVKVLAVAAILSRVSVPLSDLAYAGMFFHLMLAASAHINERKPLEAAPAVIGFALMLASFFTQNAAREVPSAYLASLGVQ